MYLDFKTKPKMSINRRNFLKKTSLSTAALASVPLLTNCESEVNSQAPSGGLYMGDHAAPKLSKIRAAFIGAGSRGVGHLKFFAGLPGTEVVAISDLYEDNVKEKLGMVNQLAEATSHSNIATYWGDENRWKTMLKEVKPDVVFIATNWNNHAPMAGRHAQGDQEGPGHGSPQAHPGRPRP